MEGKRTSGGMREWEEGKEEERTEEEGKNTKGQDWCLPSPVVTASRGGCRESRYGEIWPEPPEGHRSPSPPWGGCGVGYQATVPDIKLPE